MPMRLRAEKKMRKHLIEQLKARKVLGARIAEGKKTAEELRRLNLAPQVYLFKNLFSGQVLYSQVPAFHQDQIDQQFVRPNWENRKPSRRNDLWRVMCVATFDNYDYAVAAFRGLVQLRQARDVVQQKEAKALRRKNDEGNTWYAGQYRPTYSQEAVADLAHVIEEFELENTKLMWENAWRRGDDKHWSAELVQHETLPPFNPRDQNILLDELRAKAVEEFAKLRETEEHQEEASVIA
ncbi:transcriptional regulation of mitochondrial recombination-domain-containing protein [Scheffersomyces xylosifermentans]|uniref:transcriptional regulation of mitochondrial recombination-domain-containing protein n=1 Tax=Scheffersomyces xylosifermentans TaxID=1304137 RepID=UPI00315C9882